ncbi:MAG TPA: NAD(P)-dependent oxidoreductase [Chloroflexota bacterium]|nr:NAD(P)-dependent oxidoreductase [Chloroflexota bacterium]
MAELPRVGFVGLGIMGRPMAHNLLRAGYPLVVWNRSPGPVAELQAAGAEAAATPAALAARCDVVITVLLNTEVVEQVVLGPEGLAAGLRPGATYVDMSSISPLATRRIAARLAEQGVAALDAPVSGGEVGAREATLAIMVGGPAAVFERLRPLFEALGKSIVHVGDTGAGQVAKACNQLVVGITIDAVAEALLLARAAGVDPARVREALLGGFAQSRVLDLHGARMLEGRFAPGFRAPLQVKDLAIAAELGAATSQPLPGTETALGLYRAMVAAGLGDLDHSGLYVLLEEQGRS